MGRKINAMLGVGAVALVGAGCGSSPPAEVTPIAVVTPCPTPSPTPTLPAPPAVQGAQLGTAYGVVKMALSADGTASAVTTSTVTADPPAWSPRQISSSGGTGHYVVFKVRLAAAMDGVAYSAADFAVQKDGGEQVALTASQDNGAPNGLSSGTLGANEIVSGIVSGNLPGVSHGTFLYTPEDTATPIAWRF